MTTASCRFPYGRIIITMAIVILSNILTLIHRPAISELHGNISEVRRVGSTLVHFRGNLYIVREIHPQTDGVDGGLMLQFLSATVGTSRKIDFSQVKIPQIA